MPDKKDKYDRSEGNDLPQETPKRLRIDSDRSREPEFLPARQGTRRFSIGALIERIVTQFEGEYTRDRDPLKSADTETKRLKLILGVVDYLLAVESIHLPAEMKARIIRRSYAELFTYGPLDELLDDAKITTILLEGADKVSVRYGHGDLMPLAPIFEDESHLRTIVRRLLRDGGVDFGGDQPIIECGLSVHGRRGRVSLAAPPVTFQLTADIRVHPVVPPTLEDWVIAGYLTTQSATLLKAIAQSPHGVVIVGETESGKTTLLGMLAALAQGEEQGRMVAVERVEELHLPDSVGRFVVQWGTENCMEASFQSQVGAALDEKPVCILLDEVRTDEAQAAAPLLMAEISPRQMWAFRGTVESKRMAPALGMLARRSNPAAGESVVHALYKRLPFVVTVRRRKGTIQLYSVSEWQYLPGTEYPDYVELMAIQDGTIVHTGKYPVCELCLPGDFWGVPLESS